MNEVTLSVGDLVIVNLDPSIGHEKQKTRCCVVMETGGTPLELLIVLPITEYHAGRNKHFFVPISHYHEVGLTKPSAVDCYQIRTLSKKRLKRDQKDLILVIGKLNVHILDEIKKRLALILDITEEHTLSIE